ncbi:hypothetical protein [Amaricoccus tamworthensis]
MQDGVGGQVDENLAQPVSLYGCQNRMHKVTPSKVDIQVLERGDGNLD